jgi:hypothetical protein
MDFAKVDGPVMSGAEMAILAILVLLCIAGGWAMYRKFSGKQTSDVSGLKLGKRP